MFERFTERARQVVVLAQEEARTKHNEHITCGHLAVGLAGEEDGLAAAVLRHLDITVEDLRQAIPEEDVEVSGQIPFTDRSKRVLELALREALGMGHNYIGTEHILLSLLHDPGAAVIVFQRELGDNWKEAIKLEVTEALRGPLDREKIQKAIDESLQKAIAIDESLGDPQSTSQVAALRKQDIIDDIMNGIRRWRESKIGTDKWCDEDESLLRWLEAGDASDYL